MKLEDGNNSKMAIACMNNACKVYWKKIKNWNWGEGGKMLILKKVDGSTLVQLSMNTTVLLGYEFNPEKKLVTLVNFL